MVARAGGTASSGTGTRSGRIAEELVARIRRGVYPRGGSMPSESSLAAEFSVARGTVRLALELVEREHPLVSQQGSRWQVHEPIRRQSLDVLRSFGQWALAAGLEPTGLTVRASRGLATGAEAKQLSLRRGSPVLRIVRVMSLDCRPVMVKRTTYPEWLADIIAAVPEDARSIMEVVEDRHAVKLGHAEHQILALAATVPDARLLGIPRSTALLRVLRTVRSTDGRIFEYSDDRYRSDTVSFSVVSTSIEARD